jgi:hypothetical protein
MTHMKLLRRIAVVAFTNEFSALAHTAATGLWSTSRQKMATSVRVAMEDRQKTYFTHVCIHRVFDQRPIVFAPRPYQYR